MNKKISEFTNKELLKELAERIIHQRLEIENCSNCEATFELLNGLVNLNIWDNEWRDITKPDFTGARTNLNYWISEVRNKKYEPK